MHFELHGFIDVSERASGAWIYVKTVSASNRIVVKLGLYQGWNWCIALSRITHAFGEHKFSRFCWCYSWLASEPCVQKTFVANWMSYLQNFTTRGEWKLIESVQNPVDVISRETLLQNLANRTLWWNGPHFLYEKHYYIFNAKVLNEDCFFDRKGIRNVSLTVHSTDLSIIDRYSSYKGRLHKFSVFY